MWLQFSCFCILILVFQKSYSNLSKECFKLKSNTDICCKFCSKRFKNIKFLLVSQNRKVLEGINPNKKKSQTVDLVLVSWIKIVFVEIVPFRCFK